MSPIDFIRQGLPPGRAIAFRLMGDYNAAEPHSGPGVFRSSLILGAHPLSLEQSDRLRAVFSAPDTYDQLSMGGFVPRFGIRFGDGTDIVDILVCLSCSWVNFFRGSIPAAGSLSDVGLERLSEIWDEVFPDSCKGQS
ncbi:hypothetical protein ACXR0O_05960 [Verrucomicrobiota bacterium sgz303538]